MEYICEILSDDAFSMKRKIYIQRTLQALTRGAKTAGQMKHFQRKLSTTSWSKTQTENQHRTGIFF